MRFRYTVSFTADEIEEQAVRKALGRLGVADLKITRSSEADSNAGLSKIQRAIVSILGDDEPHWRRDIVDAARAKGFSYTGVNKALVRLTNAGQILCFKHGLYGSLKTNAEAAAAFPARKNRLSEKTSFQEVIELISEQPQTAAVLRERFQVSRQRMDQILRKAESQGLIRRLDTEFGEKGKFAYISASAGDIAGRDRKSTLLDRRKQLLSSLEIGRIYFARDLASFFDVPITSKISEALAELSRLGLVETFAVGIKLFCVLTPKGAAHPDYDPTLPKAMPVDLVSEIGPINSKYLQAMRVLGGTARTIELTYALTEAADVRSRSGQTMQKLEQVGLVHRVENKPLRQNSHSLTETGRRVAAYLDEHINPPARSDLEARITRRMEERAATLRRVAETTNRGRGQAPVK
jgi:DNA-binding MarR family transcriptional regulator